MVEQPVAEVRHTDSSVRYYCVRFFINIAAHVKCELPPDKTSGIRRLGEFNFQVRRYFGRN